jgi:hypothetical protein
MEFCPQTDDTMAKQRVSEKRTSSAESMEVVISDRRDNDRRKPTLADRRKKQIPVAVDRRASDRRVGERRRQIDPTTCEREYNNEEIEFMKAIEDYKRDFRRPFPTWSEVLEVMKALGYRRVADETEIVANRAKANIVDDCAL